MNREPAGKTQATMPLAMAAPGEPVQLVRIEGGQVLRNRLASMGLVTGSYLEVISGSLNGPMVVAVDRTRIMLGRGLAHQVRVSVI